MTEEEKNMEQEFEEAWNEEKKDDKEEEANVRRTEDEGSEEDDVGSSETPEGNETDSGSEIDWQAKAEDLENQLAKANHKMSSWEGRISKANQEKKETEERLAEALKKNEEFEQRLKSLEDGKEEKPSEEEDDSEEDDPDLKQLMDDFPDLIGPIKRATKRMATQIAEQIVEKKMKPSEKESKTEVKEESTEDQTGEDNQEEARKVAEAHFGKIKEAHPDFEQYVKSGAVLAFIERQPEEKKAELKDIYAGGSADDVIKLLDGFYADKKKREQGRRQAAEAVENHPTNPPKPKADKEDFDKAWDDALKEEGKK